MPEAQPSSVGDPLAYAGMRGVTPPRAVAAGEGWPPDGGVGHVRARGVRAG